MTVKNIFLCVLLIFSLSCSSTGAAEKIHFAIPSRSVSVMPFYIAGQEGFYRDEGLELEMIHMSSQIAVTTTLAGSVEFSSTPGPAVNAAGADLKAIFIVAQRPLHDLITSPGVRSFADLKGKVLGLTSMGSMSDNLTRRILRKNGLDPDHDVALRVIGTETLQVAALKNGVIDVSDGMIIDATKPIHRPFAEKLELPQEVLEKVRKRLEAE